jgi:hypothetical protein
MPLIGSCGLLVISPTYDIRKLETPKLLNFKIPVPPLPEEQRILFLENNGERLNFRRCCI